MSSNTIEIISKLKRKRERIRTYSARVSEYYVKKLEYLSELITLHSRAQAGDIEARRIIEEYGRRVWQAILDKITDYKLEVLRETIKDAGIAINVDIGSSATDGAYIYIGLEMTASILAALDTGRDDVINDAIFLIAHEAAHIALDHIPAVMSSGDGVVSRIKPWNVCANITADIAADAMALLYTNLLAGVKHNVLEIVRRKLESMMEVELDVYGISTAMLSSIDTIISSISTNIWLIPISTTTALLSLIEAGAFTYLITRGIDEDLAAKAANMAKEVVEVAMSPSVTVTDKHIDMAIKVLEIISSIPNLDEEIIKALNNNDMVGLAAVALLGAAQLITSMTIDKIALNIASAIAEAKRLYDDGYIDKAASVIINALVSIIVKSIILGDPKRINLSTAAPGYPRYKYILTPCLSPLGKYKCPLMTKTKLSERSLTTAIEIMLTLMGVKVNGVPRIVDASKLASSSILLSSNLLKLITVIDYIILTGDKEAAEPIIKAITYALNSIGNATNVELETNLEDELRRMISEIASRRERIEEAINGYINSVLSAIDEAISILSRYKHVEGIDRYVEELKELKNILIDSAQAPISSVTTYLKPYYYRIMNLLREAANLIYDESERDANRLITLSVTVSPFNLLSNAELSNLAALSIAAPLAARVAVLTSVVVSRVIDVNEIDTAITMVGNIVDAIHDVSWIAAGLSALGKVRETIREAERSHAEEAAAARRAAAEAARQAVDVSNIINTIYDIATNVISRSASSISSTIIANINRVVDIVTSTIASISAMASDPSIAALRQSVVCSNNTERLAKAASAARLLIESLAAIEEASLSEAIDKLSSAMADANSANLDTTLINRAISQLASRDIANAKDTIKLALSIYVGEVASIASDVSNSCLPIIRNPDLAGQVGDAIKVIVKTAEAISKCMAGKTVRLSETGISNILSHPINNELTRVAYEYMNYELMIENAMSKGDKVSACKEIAELMHKLAEAISKIISAETSAQIDESTKAVREVVSRLEEAESTLSTVINIMKSYNIDTWEAEEALNLIDSAISHILNGEVDEAINELKRVVDLLTTSTSKVVKSSMIGAGINIGEYKELSSKLDSLSNSIRDTVRLLLSSAASYATAHGGGAIMEARRLVNEIETASNLAEVAGGLRRMSGSGGQPAPSDTETEKAVIVTRALIRLNDAREALSMGMILTAKKNLELAAKDLEKAGYKEEAEKIRRLAESLPEPPPDEVTRIVRSIEDAAKEYLGSGDSRLTGGLLSARQQFIKKVTMAIKELYELWREYSRRGDAWAAINAKITADLLSIIINAILAMPTGRRAYTKPPVQPPPGGIQEHRAPPTQQPQPGGRQPQQPPQPVQPPQPQQRPQQQQPGGIQQPQVQPQVRPGAQPQPPVQPQPVQPQAQPPLQPPVKPPIQQPQAQPCRQPQVRPGAQPQAQPQPVQPQQRQPPQPPMQQPQAQQQPGRMPQPQVRPGAQPQQLPQPKPPLQPPVQPPQPQQRRPPAQQPPQIQPGGIQEQRMPTAPQQQPQPCRRPQPVQPPVSPGAQPQAQPQPIQAPQARPQARPGAQPGRQPQAQPQPAQPSQPQPGGMQQPPVQPPVSPGAQPSQAPQPVAQPPQPGGIQPQQLPQPKPPLQPPVRTPIQQPTVRPPQPQVQQPPQPPVQPPPGGIQEHRAPPTQQPQPGGRQPGGKPEHRMPVVKPPVEQPQQPSVWGGWGGDIVKLKPHYIIKRPSRDIEEAYRRGGPSEVSRTIRRRLLERFKGKFDKYKNIGTRGYEPGSETTQYLVGRILEDIEKMKFDLSRAVADAVKNVISEMIGKPSWGVMPRKPHLYMKRPGHKREMVVDAAIMVDCSGSVDLSMVVKFVSLAARALFEVGGVRNLMLYFWSNTYTYKIIDNANAIDYDEIMRIVIKQARMPPAAGTPMLSAARTFIELCNSKQFEPTLIVFTSDFIVPTNEAIETAEVLGKFLSNIRPGGSGVIVGVNEGGYISNAVKFENTIKKYVTATQLVVIKEENR